MFRPAFAEFVAPAEARPQLWRLLLGVALAIIVYVALVAALFGLLWLTLGAEGAARRIDELRHAGSPAATLLLLLTFAGMAFGAIAAARVLHGRGAGTLFGPRARVIRDFLIACGIVAFVLGVSSIGWLRWFDPLPGLDPGLWLRLLPLALLGVLLQTGAEELLFRGYLQQQLAARFRTPVAWLILPSLLFGAVHLDPGSAGANAWVVVFAAAAFGLAASDLTAATGSIGAAWGFHFVNNCVALLLIATQGTLPGLALYLTPYQIGDSDVVRSLVLWDLAAMAVAWGLIRRALRR